MSILNISSKYSRKLRVLDIFLKIYMTFFFSLIPFVAMENNKFSKTVTNRNVTDLGRSLEETGFDIQQVKKLFTILRFSTV
jgi:hypothetical protein